MALQKNGNDCVTCLKSKTIFSANFTRICQDANIDDLTLATHLNVSVADIALWRLGVTEPTLSQLAQLCRLFGLSADKFLFLTIDSRSTIFA